MAVGLVDQGSQGGGGKIWQRGGPGGVSGGGSGSGVDGGGRRPGSASCGLVFAVGQR